MDPDDPCSHPDAEQLDRLSVADWLRDRGAGPDVVRARDLSMLALSAESVERTSLLRAGAAAWVASMCQRGQNIAASSTRERERPEYVMAQLAHALLTEVALDCGYPSSALKERIYVLPMSSSG